MVFGGLSLWWELIVAVVHGTEGYGVGEGGGLVGFGESIAVVRCGCHVGDGGEKLEKGTRKEGQQEDVSVQLTNAIRG